MLLENRKEGKFNRKAAEERIREMERLSQETGVPGLIAMVANQLDEMKRYIDFFIGVTDMPFAIDVWVQKTRLAIARYIAELGIQDRVLYNSITPWDEDNEAQVAEIKELGIKTRRRAGVRCRGQETGWQGKVAQENAAHREKR